MCTSLAYVRIIVKLKRGRLEGFSTQCKDLSDALLLEILVSDLQVGDTYISACR